jgi:hypothetical protein
MKEPAEMNNAPVNVEKIVEDMLVQVEAEDAAKALFDKDAVDTALILEGEMDKRIREAVAKAWNERLRTYVETRIQEEVAELGTRLGRQIHQLINGETGGRL